MSFFSKSSAIATIFSLGLSFSAQAFAEDSVVVPRMLHLFLVMLFSKFICFRP